VNGISPVSGAVPENGENDVCAFTVPHESGLASAANPPPLKRRRTCVNGAGGFSVNVAVI
jgi:hypothetical protein